MVETSGTSLSAAMGHMPTDASTSVAQSNAVDFAANKVEVDARWSGDEVRIIIADDGAGFPPYVLEQLGEPFVTTRPGQNWRQEERDEHIGMGLGFFIAKTLLERSGARLELANKAQPLGGAVVTVRLAQT